MIWDYHLDLLNARIMREKLVFKEFLLYFLQSQKFIYISLVFGRKAFKPTWVKGFGYSHNSLLEFWPIPSDRTGGTESGL